MENLLDHLILSSFPELSSEDIQLEIKTLKDAVMTSGPFKSEGFFIEVDSIMKDAPEPIVIGGFAHELAHINHECKMDRRQSFRDKILYSISPRYRELDERNTDLDVILRGLGSELLQFLEFCKAQGLPPYREDGLSIREIKKIISQ